MEDFTDAQRMLLREEGKGRHAGTQAGFQLALLTSTLLMATLGGLLTGTASQGV